MAERFAVQLTVATSIGSVLSNNRLHQCIGASTMTCIGNIVGFVALISIIGCSGRNDNNISTSCQNLSQEKIESAISSKLKEKYSIQLFELTNYNYVASSKVPFWHSQATTGTLPNQQVLFAMYYCNGSIELTALTPDNQTTKK